MISGLMRAWENLFGRGDAAVTVPPLDGALRPNRKLDEASQRLPLDGVDNLASINGQLLATAGPVVYMLDEKDNWGKLTEYETDIVSITQIGESSVRAVALADGEIILAGGRYDGRRYQVDPTVRCITAMAEYDEVLYIANGSATHRPENWQSDLLERNATGSVWQVDLDSGESRKLADGIAFPAGIIADASGVVYAEAWRHRLVRLSQSGSGDTQVLYTDMPGYPGRITADPDGFWLAVFAPRSQLVELVLREPEYRRRMMAEISRPYWIAPNLRSGRSFYEPLQGGGVKHLGVLKPWAPTMSAGLCVRLTEDFQPRFSLHSRADGVTHGVTSVTEHAGRVFVAARGDGVVVSLGADELGDNE